MRTIAAALARWVRMGCGALRRDDKSTLSPNLATRAAAEALGCAMFHFIGSVSPTAAANGLALIVLVYYTAKVSGAHLNPAISLTFCVLGHVGPLEFAVYTLAQVCGCVVGALWLAALIPDLYPGGYVPLGTGCFEADPQLTHAQVFGWEAVGTFCFVVPVFSVVWYTQRKSGYGNTGPLIVGLSLMAAAMAVGPWTGAALNPARVVASPIVFSCPRSGDRLLFYVLGELAGAIAAAAAILPWYGISLSPWYARALPMLLRDTLDAMKTPPATPNNVPTQGNGSPVRTSDHLATMTTSAPSFAHSHVHRLSPRPSAPGNGTSGVVPENAYACVLPFELLRHAKTRLSYGGGGNQPMIFDDPQRTPSRTFGRPSVKTQLTKEPAFGSMFGMPLGSPRHSRPIPIPDPLSAAPISAPHPTSGSYSYPNPRPGTLEEEESDYSSSMLSPTTSILNSGPPSAPSIPSGLSVPSPPSPHSAPQAPQAPQAASHVRTSTSSTRSTPSIPEEAARVYSQSQLVFRTVPGYH